MDFGRIGLILLMAACGTATAGDDDNVPRAVVYIATYPDGTSCDAGCCPDGFDLLGFSGSTEAVCLEQR